MASSEGNYSLALDYPLPQESTIPEQQGPESQSLLAIIDLELPITLYQRNYSSRKKLDQADPNNFEVDMYTSDFQLGIFFRSFFICLFYTSGIGMILSALCRCFHTQFYRNYFHESNTPLLRIVGTASIIQMVFLIIMPQKEIEDALGKVSSITNWTAILYALIIFSVTSAAREAYCHQKFVEVLKMVRLDGQSLSSTRFRVDYLWSRDLSSRIKSLEKQRKEEGGSKEDKENFVREVVEYERTCAIQTTISRLNINMSLHYLSFFEGTPENLLRKLKQKQDLAVIEQGDFLIYKERFPEQDLLKAISHFEHDIFKYKHLTKPNKYDENKAFAYSLALDILFNKKQKASAAALMAWVIPATLLTLQYMKIAVTLLTNFELQDRSVSEQIFSLVVTIPVAKFFSWVPYANTLYVISQGIKVLTTKYLYLEELKELMSTKTERLDDNGEKSYPTLNILDYKSLESWMRLRKIFMHLYDEKLQGIILGTSLALIIQFIRSISHILVKLIVDRSLGSADFVQYGLHMVFYLAIFLVFAYFAARANAQFKVHRGIILVNKQIAEALFKYYSDFIGEDCSSPGSYIENEGVKFLKEQFGDKISAEMKEEKEILLATYESILAELEREECENPIKILGLPITKTVVKSSVTLLVSLLLSVIKVELAYLF